MPPQPILATKPPLCTVMNQRPLYIDAMNLLKNGIVCSWPHQTPTDWRLAFILPAPATRPTWAEGYIVTCCVTAVSEATGNVAPKSIPVYVLHYDGLLKGGITSNVLQPVHADVTFAYEVVGTNTAAARQPFCFEVHPWDVANPMHRRFSESVSDIEHSLLRWIENSFTTPEQDAILARFLDCLKSQYGSPRIWAFGEDTHSVMAYVTNAIEVTGPIRRKAYLELEMTCEPLFAEYEPEWRLYNEITGDFEYSHSSENVYWLVNGFLNPSAIKHCRTLYGANTAYFRAQTDPQGWIDRVHPLRFQFFFEWLKIRPGMTHCLKITEVVPYRIPHCETVGLCYTAQIRSWIATLWDKVRELYRAVHTNEKYAGLFGSSVLWIKRPVVGQFPALYNLLAELHSVFVVQYAVSRHDEKQQKSPFSANDYWGVGSALQQLLVNQFSPLAIGERRPDSDDPLWDRCVSDRYWWHFPASRAMVFVCLQGSLVLYAPGFSPIHLQAPQAVMLPGKLWHQATPLGRTLPQTLTIIY